VVVLTGVVFARALAQEAAPEATEPKEEAAAPKGGQHPLAFSAETVAEYTDNRDGQAAKASTLDLYLRPRGDLTLDTQRGILDAYYAPAYRYRTNPAKDRSPSDFFHDLGIEGKLRATSRLTLGASDTLNESDDPSAEKNATRMRRDARYLLNQAKADASVKVSPRTELDIEGRHNIKRYGDRDLWTVGNEESMVGTLSYWFRMAKGVGLAAIGRVEKFDYPLNGAVNRDFVSPMGALGVEYKVARSLMAMGTLGWKQLNFADPELGTQSGPSVRLGVRGSVNPALRLSTALSRTLRDSDVYPYAAQQYTSAEGSVEWDVLKELMLSLVAAYRLGQYDASTLPRAFLQSSDTAGREVVSSGSTSGGDEDVMVFQGEVKYSVGQGKSLRLYQRHEQFHSDLSESFDRNSTGLAFTMQF
jgi:hypothetical protein